MRRVLKRFSLRTILLLSLVLATGRWLIIGWYPDYLGWLIFAQLLHAASFGCTHVVAIHLVHSLFWRTASGQRPGLYSSLSFGLGGGLAVFIAAITGSYSVQGLFIQWRDYVALLP